MVRNALSILLVPLCMVSAQDSFKSRQDATGIPRTLIVGAPGQILSYSYNGTSFTKIASSSTTGTSASWMIFKHPNRLYAVDENSNSTRLFDFSPINGGISGEPVSIGNGSSGVVSLEFNKNKTSLVGASYSQGQVDVWDISSPEGELTLLKQVPLPGPTGPAEVQSIHRAHQAALDPTGRFFAIADLGGDAIHFLDASTWEIANSISVEPAGAGPRHGAFIGGNCTTLPSHYAVTCELKNIVILWELEGTEDGKIGLKNPQTLSTFGEAFPPKNTTSAAAGELIASHNGRDIYVSNRLSGNETDSISHFLIQDGKLVFADQISSGGISPRQLSFSTEESWVFCANTLGDNGLVAFSRSFEDGTLKPAGALSMAQIAAEPGFGPQFVTEVPMLPEQVPAAWVNGTPQWF